MSYTKVDKDKYRIFISDGFNLDGSRRRFSKTITTDLKGRDLEKFLFLQEMEFEEEIKKKDPKFHLLAKGTFEAYSVWWLGYKKLEDKTRDNYQNFLDLRILPLIGKKILDKITTGDMLELMNIIETAPSEKTKKPLSTKSVKHYHTLLKTMFSDAITLKIINDNPMENVPVKTPKAQLKDNYYTLEDINSLLKILPTAPIRYQLAILLTISTGIRLGELSGLQWRHIDVNNNILIIEQANSYAAKKSKIKDTKTDSSVRKISFPSFLIDLIEEHRENEKLKKELLGDQWFYEENEHENDFVFTQKNGKVIFKDTISDWFRKFIENNELKKITFHGLRHTSTTVLITSGINVKNVSNRLGHSRASTTTDFYAHALETVDKESADIFNDIFSKKEDEEEDKEESGTEGGTRVPYLRVVK
ncbi:site-specific integrase [Tissierella praeacuta]|uniref:tyrosine-type recombinase/integrase n=1 Tax=Tissierella praeacuta TaxID=43131 RepID=UPI0033415405